MKSLAVISDKLETSDENVIVHYKVFHEPQYQGVCLFSPLIASSSVAEADQEAKQAKEARLAHYADLESNYALHVESGFF